MLLAVYTISILNTKLINIGIFAYGLLLYAGHIWRGMVEISEFAVNKEEMKKLLILSTLCAMVIACEKPEPAKPICVHTDPVPVAPKATNGDEYLYSITVNDLDFFAAGEVIKKFFEMNDASPVGCSAVRIGKYYGRNLDYYVNKNADFIIRTSASNARFASIGTSADYPRCLKESIDNGTLTDEDYAAIAYYMLDGINEKGVAINVNVVPCGECKRTTGTNPGAPDVVTSGVVRYVLDHATSVENAIDLLEGINIVIPSEEKFPFEVHWMISDANRTVCVEIWDNELVIVEDNVMTNFYVSHPDTEMGTGHERYEVLKAHLDEGTSIDGMHGLMKRAWYSNAYSTKTDPLWYSEFLSDGCGFTWSDIKAGRVERAYAYISAAESLYGSVEYQKSKRTSEYWYTTHSIIYDLEARTMSLVAQENDTVWEFAL